MTTAARTFALSLALASAAGCTDRHPTAATGPVVSVVVEGPATVVTAGRKMHLTAHALDEAGRTVSGAFLAWSTTDPRVLTVSAAGEVTGVAEGNASVTVIVGDASGTVLIGGVSATVQMRVAPEAIPFFQRPFDGPFRLLNAFDHDVPIHQFRAGIITDWRGRTLNGLEGHNGYDWPMPVGTPLRAVADGRVTYAQYEPPFACSLLGGATVSALVVAILHTAPGGERFTSQYVHLSSTSVAVGDQVSAGQVIGLSGNTGCSTLPHLHFGVLRERYTMAARATVTDPSGWEPATLDPWVAHPSGAASTRLWIAGQEPPLVQGASPGVPVGAESPVLNALPFPPS